MDTVLRTYIRIHEDLINAEHKYLVLGRSLASERDATARSMTKPTAVEE